MRGEGSTFWTVWVVVWVCLATIPLLTIYTTQRTLCHTRWVAHGLESKFTVPDGCRVKTKTGEWITEREAQAREL
jgi:hypothetical protein